MSSARLNWNGDKLLERVVEAARVSIDETTAEAADIARASHVWVNRPTRFSKTGGQLEEEIKTEDAHVEGTRVIGRFGTTRRRGFVGLFHEEGTVHEFARPFLRPAADVAFQTLVSKIRRRLG